MIVARIARTICLISFGASICAAALAEHAPLSSKLTLTPEEMKYGVRPGAPANVTSSEPIGDPSKNGVYVLRNKWPPHSKLPPHTHSDAWRVMTVLEGTLYFAYGETFDEGKLKRLGPGSLIVEPQGTPHYFVTKEEGVLLQIVAEGPFTTERVANQ